MFQRSTILACVLATVIVPILSIPQPAWADAAGDLTSGRAALAAGELEKALPLLSAAAQALPDSVEAQLSLAECHLRLGQLDKALAQYRKVLKLSPDHAIAKRMVQSLTGMGGTIAQRLAAADDLIETGAYAAAEAMLLQLLHEATEPDQRHLAHLRLAEARLWNGNTAGALTDAVRLIHESGSDAIAQSARAIAGLALVAEEKPEQAAEYLKAAGKPAGIWAQRVEVAAALLNLKDRAQSAAISQTLLKSFSSIPRGKYRQRLTEQAFGKLSESARQLVGRGEVPAAVAIVWPMVASGAAPGRDVVLKDIAVTGGWLETDATPGRWEVAQLFVEIGKTEAAQNPRAASLWGFWVGAQILKPIASRENTLDQLLRIAGDLAPLSRPAPDRKVGEPLSSADEVQRAILLICADAANFEAHRQQIASQIINQWNRYENADDTATGLARFVTVDLEAKPAKIVWAGAIGTWQAGAAHQALLNSLGTHLGALGQKEFERSKATLAIEANSEINKFDAMALVVLGHAALIYSQEPMYSARALTIVERYSADEQWPAATAALTRFYSVQAADAGLWVSIQQKFRQAIKAENALLAVNRHLDKGLSPLMIDGLKQIVAELKTDTSKSTRQTAIRTLDPLVSRYAGLERYDLAEAVIAAIAGEAGSSLADWALWSRASLLHGQATRRLAQAAAVPDAGPTLKLDDGFKAEFTLYDELIQKHPQSDFIPAAVQRILSIVSAYQNHRAFDVALSILDGFLKVHPKLAIGEQMEFRRISVLLAKANLKFSQRKDKNTPPPALLPEHAAALDSLTAFLKAHPTGRFAEQAESTLLAVARQYGTEGAWPVVRQVLARYAAAVPDLRQPSRLKLLEAATYLGELDRGYGLSLLVPLPRSGATAPSGMALAYDDRYDDAKKGEAAVDKLVLEDLHKVQDELKPRSETYGPSPEGNGRGPASGEPARPGSRPQPYPAPTIPAPAEDPFAPRPGDAMAGAKSEPSESSLAMIRQSQQRQFQSIAMLESRQKEMKAPNQGLQGQQAASEVILPAGVVLSAEEMTRQDTAADKAYAILLALVKNTDPAEAAIATDARNRLLWLFGFFEGQLRADRAAALLRRYIADHPADPAQRALAYQAINDQFVWAAQVQPNDRIDRAWLEGRHKLFEDARAEVKAFLKTVEEQPDWQRRARLLTIDSFETEAKLASAMSQVRAGGLLVRGVNELLEILLQDADQAAVLNVPHRLWAASQQLQSWGQQDMAAFVLGQIPHRFPTHPLATQAVLHIAQLHAHDLSDPLKALETYLEYISLAGDNESIRQSIFQMAQQLGSRRRYLEALHVYGVFVDSFPSDHRAPLALNAIGQTHQTNEAWSEALKAYQRILDEYPSANLLPQVKLAIAECHIHRSEWKQARKLYEEYLTQYPNDGKQEFLRRRNDMLKTLDRYQTLLADAQVNRNKDDAQFQIGRIVMEQLNLPTKALEEFAKVVKNFPKSDLADDAQLEVGKTLIALGRLPEARTELLKVPVEYPNSPVADDALYLAGQTFEQEAVKLASVTAETSRELAFEQGQRGAYSRFNDLQQTKDKQQALKRDSLRKAGKQADLDVEEASSAAQYSTFNAGNIANYNRSAEMQAETESALQVANRQDRINEAYREAVSSYAKAAKDYPLGDKTDQSLLRIAQIFETHLKDRDSAMETYQRIVKLFPGTPVAEDAAWKVAQFHEQEGKFTEAAAAYREFIRNYPGSSRVADAQFALAEVLEQLGRWVDAMDAYETFRQKFGQHPKALAALEQINWIKAYRK